MIYCLLPPHDSRSVDQLTSRNPHLFACNTASRSDGLSRKIGDMADPRSLEPFLPKIPTRYFCVIFIDHLGSTVFPITPRVPTSSDALVGTIVGTRL